MRAIRVRQSDLFETQRTRQSDKSEAERERSKVKVRARHRESVTKRESYLRERPPPLEKSTGAGGTQLAVDGGDGDKP